MATVTVAGAFVAAIMAFKRDKLPSHSLPPAGYAALVTVGSAAFYYNAVCLFLLRKDVLERDANGFVTALDDPVIMFLVLFTAFVAMTLYFGQDQRSKEMLAKFDSLPNAKKRNLTLAALAYFFGSVVWLVFELVV
ncbi:hypothetical protein [Lentisalinibacter orientalis]|uniref:hypothetical protein n=1 Tax=Lentisalinibacter orientalis TaxID=2992241 RepID=UPI003870994B